MKNTEKKEKIYGWSVSIADSGDCLRDNFTSQKEAYAWLNANFSENERAALIVEPEDNEAE